MANNYLWTATQYPDRSIENVQRAARLLSYLCDNESGVFYRDIRRDLGLSYHQTVRAVDLLCAMDMAVVHVQAVWNGQHYIYPHKVSIPTPVPVIRG